MLFDRPWDEVAIKGIRNDIKRVSVVGSDQELKHRKIGGASWMEIPGVLWVEVPEEVLDPNATVLKIELEGPLDLYTGAGAAIESN
jgi:alpha-L-fucosidase